MATSRRLRQRADDAASRDSPSHTGNTTPEDQAEPTDEVSVLANEVAELRRQLAEQAAATNSTQRAADGATGPREQSERGLQDPRPEADILAVPKQGRKWTVEEDPPAGVTMSERKSHIDIEKAFRVAEPEAYGSSPSLVKAQAFIQQCERVYRTHPYTYFHQYERVQYAAGRLRAHVGNNWESMETRLEREEMTWPMFKAWLLDQILDPENRSMQMAYQAFRHTQRSNQTIHDYITHIEDAFREADVSPLPERTFLTLIKTGLKDSLKSKLNVQPTIPDNRRDLVALCTRLDDTKVSGRDPKGDSPEKSRRTDNRQISRHRKREQNQSMQENASISRRPRYDGGNPATGTNQTPSNFPKPRKPNERKAREQGLCFSCGSKDHLSRDCDKGKA